MYCSIRFFIDVTYSPNSCVNVKVIFEQPIKVYLSGVLAYNVQCLRRNWLAVFKPRKFAAFESRKFLRICRLRSLLCSVWCWSPTVYQLEIPLPQDPLKLSLVMVNMVLCTISVSALNTKIYVNFTIYYGNLYNIALIHAHTNEDYFCKCD